jgi:hypothetical protein
MRPVVLESDFADYYDAYFDSPSSVSPLKFSRFTNQGMKRREILEFLGRNGFSVPKFGTVKQVGKWAPHLRDSQLVVVYLDEESHRGENKFVMTIGEAMAKHPECLAAEFLGARTDSSRGWRLVQVAMKYFWVELESSNDWRASSGDVKATVKKHGCGQQTRLFYPLFAVDFVPVIVSGNEIRYAVDFSSAPMVGEYGIPDLLPPEVAAQEIKQMVNMLHHRK